MRLCPRTAPAVLLLSAAGLLVPAVMTSQSAMPHRAITAADSLHIDSLLTTIGGARRATSASGPGCSLAIARDGRVQYLAMRGAAVVEHNVLIDSLTTFNVGSIGKQFTAAAVLLLEQRGRLSLDDSIARWIPTWPAAAPSPRVRDLLHHTSGLRDYGALGMLAGSFPRTMPEFLTMMQRQRGGNFLPGARHDYSHSDYTLLALIIERAAGMSFGRFLEDSLFTPAGLTHTRVMDDRRPPLAGLALAYDVDPLSASPIVRTRFPSSEMVGGNNVYTTAHDLLAWELALQAGQFLPSSVVQALRAPLADVPAPVMPYAYGRWFESHRTQRVVHRSGGGGGFATTFVSFPDASVAVALLCNRAGAYPFLVARAIADQLAPSANPPQMADHDTVPMAGEAARVAGQYLPPVTPWNPLVLNAHGERLYDVFDGDSVEFVRRRDGTWIGDEYVYTFSVDVNGRPTHTVLQGPQLREESVREVVRAPWRPSRATLSRYAARWFSDELEVRWTTRVARDTLWLERPGAPAVALEPLRPGAFRASVRNGAGVPTWIGVSFEGPESARDLVVGTFPAPFELAVGVRFTRVP